MKKSFTFYEVIVVLVVIGILTAVALPHFQEDILQEAADQIISHIRYTKHLAIMDDRFNPKDENWYKKRWRIAFRDCSGSSSQKYYVVYRDLNIGGASSAPGRDESAINPYDGKKLYNSGNCQENDTDSPEVLIGQKYDIVEINPTGGCSNRYIAFDFLGRPYSTVYGSNQIDGLLHQDCNITFKTSDNRSFTITIKKETGYVKLVQIKD